MPDARQLIVREDVDGGQGLALERGDDDRPAGLDNRLVLSLDILASFIDQEQEIESKPVPALIEKTGKTCTRDLTGHIAKSGGGGQCLDMLARVFEDAG